MNEIKKTTLHPDNQPNTDLYPKTSADQVEGLREFVEQYSSDVNLENGTGDVLVQTTDTNHSFKVMKDGRAKVKATPIDNDDAVRLEDIHNKYVRRYNASVINERRAYVVNPSGLDETVPINISAVGYDLPIRTSTGQLKANAPINNDDCATKKYVDDNIASHSGGGKLYRHIIGYTDNTFSSFELVIYLTQKNTSFSLAEFIAFTKEKNISYCLSTFSIGESGKITGTYYLPGLLSASSDGEKLVATGKKPGVALQDGGGVSFNVTLSSTGNQRFADTVTEL